MKAHEDEPALTRHRLDNGVQVVVAEDHAVPAVAVNLWYDVGSRHEESGRTGLAHLFEHLMFQGSAHVASGEHFAALQAIGAQLNATTSFDRTNYFETVPVGGFELALWLEADRMGGLLDALTQENLDNQRDVVKNERRQRYDNQPYGTALERLYALLFPEDHPYHHLPIGSMADLDAASLEDVRAFFRTHYAPEHAVLSIVGDVAAEEALAAVATYFGGIRSGGAARTVHDGTLDPLPAVVRADVREDVPAEALYCLWRTPADGGGDADAAEVALHVLAGGASSRLFRRLVRRESLAQDVHGSLNRLVGGVSAGMIVVRALSGAPIADVEPILEEELERFADEGPTEEEFERAGAALERAWLEQTATYEGLADELSRCTSLFGDPALAYGMAERLRAVSPRQVRMVAEAWLRADRRAQLTYRLDEVKEDRA